MAPRTASSFASPLAAMKSARILPTGCPLLGQLIAGRQDLFALSVPCLSWSARRLYHRSRNADHAEIARSDGFTCAPVFAGDPRHESATARRRNRGRQGGGCQQATLSPLRFRRVPTSAARRHQAQRWQPPHRPRRRLHAASQRLLLAKDLRRDHPVTRHRSLQFIDGEMLATGRRGRLRWGCGSVAHPCQNPAVSATASNSNNESARHYLCRHSAYRRCEIATPWPSSRRRSGRPSCCVTIANQNVVTF